MSYAIATGQVTERASAYHGGRTSIEYHPDLRYGAHPTAQAAKASFARAMDADLAKVDDAYAAQHFDRMARSTRSWKVVRITDAELVLGWIMNLEQIAINYALAYDALKKARAELREACALMVTFDPFVGQSRRFEELRGPNGEVGKWVHAGTYNEVTDPADLAIIKRWRLACQTQAEASRRFGAHKAAFLRAGRKLAKAKRGGA